MAIGEMGKALRDIQIAFDAGTATGLTDRQLLERFAAGADQIGSLEARIESDTAALERLKEQRRRAMDDQLDNVKLLHNANADAVVKTGPRAKSAVRTPEAPDHDRRLRDVEQKLERILNLLEGAERDRRLAQ